MERLYQLMDGTSPDLEELCLSTSERMSISPFMVEKDTWVTLVLGHLFRDSHGGGTSSSRAAPACRSATG